MKDIFKVLALHTVLRSIDLWILLCRGEINLSSPKETSIKLNFKELCDSYPGMVVEEKARGCRVHVLEAILEYLQQDLVSNKNSIKTQTTENGLHTTDCCPLKS